MYRNSAALRGYSAAIPVDKPSERDGHTFHYHNPCWEFHPSIGRNNRWHTPFPPEGFSGHSLAFLGGKVRAVSRDSHTLRPACSFVLTINKKEVGKLTKSLWSAGILSPHHRDTFECNRERSGPVTRSDPKKLQTGNRRGSSISNEMWSEQPSGNLIRR